MSKSLYLSPKISDIGLIEALWNIFGGSVSEQGYKILNPNAEPEIVTLTGIEYYITNGEAIAMAYKGTGYSVVVPSTVEGYPVTTLLGT